MRQVNRLASCISHFSKLTVYFIVQAIAVGSLLGCADGHSDRVALHAVSGRIVSSDKPVEGALVVLHPDPAAPSSNALYPHGETGPAGEFELSTYDQGDGAPSGNWIVTLTWPDQRLAPEKKQQLLATGDTLPDRLRGRFATPSASRWKVTIDEQTTRLPDIDLMGR